MQQEPDSVAEFLDHAPNGQVDAGFDGQLIDPREAESTTERNPRSTFILTKISNCRKVLRTFHSIRNYKTASKLHIPYRPVSENDNVSLLDVQGNPLTVVGIGTSEVKISHISVDVELIILNDLSDFPFI